MAGMIGAGKSTYTEMISRRLGTEAFFESVDYNPILDKFYDNPQKWAFSLQIYFLNTRFRSIKAALTDDNNVLDRSIYEDALFTRVNHLQGNMMEELEGMPKKAPDLLIYLDGSFETILDHIRKRGREFEQIEDDSELLSYYELLFKNYEQWYQEYDQSPKIKINIDTFDIVNNSGDEEKVMSSIENALLEVSGEEVELTCAGSNIV